MNPELQHDFGVIQATQILAFCLIDKYPSFLFFISFFSCFLIKENSKNMQNLTGQPKKPMSNI